MNSQIILNSDKCRILDDGEFEPLPNELIRLLGVGNYASDTYLFEAAYTIVDNRTIVTTDNRLIKHVRNQADCRLVLLDNFLQSFSF